MLKLCSELEMVVSCYEARRDKLRESKEMYVTSKLLSRLIGTSLGAHKWLSEVKWLSFVCWYNYYYIFFKWTKVAGREAAGADGCEWPCWTTENWKGETLRAQVSEANYISDFCLLCHISSVLLVKEGSIAATIQKCLISVMHLKENRLKGELCTRWRGFQLLNKMPDIELKYIHQLVHMPNNTSRCLSYFIKCPICNI